MPLVEVRTPTFRRTSLLRRALESLRAQTHREWICRVLDDDPAGSAEAICRSMADDRIKYEPNGSNLGIGANIDRAFSLAPLPGSSFLCVLEDDNYYLPDNLRKNVSRIEEYGLDILLRNQIIENMTTRDKPGQLSKRTSFDRQYNSEVLSHDRLFSSFFYSTGANNASLFWRANSGLTFSTLNYLDDPVSQERLRTLCIDRDVIIDMEPLIVWRDNGEESLRPKLPNRLRWTIAQIRAAADERCIYRALFTYLEGRGLTDLIYQTTRGEFTAAQERVLLRVGISVPHRYRRTPWRTRVSLSLKRGLASMGAKALRRRCPLYIAPDERRLS